MDKMLCQYTTKRKTFRWSLALFFNFLDVSALAAYIIFSSNNPEGSNSVKNGRRRMFLQHLGQLLCIPQIKKRAQNPRVTGNFIVRNAMECILGEPIGMQDANDEFIANEREEDATGRVRQLGGCYVCYRDEKRKRATRQTCVSCQKPVCVQHGFAQTKCQDCYMN